MLRIMISGGAGLIGSNLAMRLIRDGNLVFVVDNLLTGSEENLSDVRDNSNFVFIKHDVTQPITEDLQIDALFHLASPASPNYHSRISYHNLAMETMLVNTAGTLELLQYAHKKNAKFLFASTSEVYGDPLEHPQKEEYRGNVSTTGPRSVYDEAKRFGETLTAYFWREKGLNARIARIFNTYGPNMNKDDLRMVIEFIVQALRNEPITVFGDGSQTRALCYVDDLVEGLTRLMFYENTNRQIINLGNPDEHTVLEYAKIIREMTNSKSEIVFSEALPQDDPLKRMPDISRAKEILSWEPKVTLRDGLDKMIEYVKSTM